MKIVAIFLCCSWSIEHDALCVPNLSEPNAWAYYVSWLLNKLSDSNILNVTWSLNDSDSLILWEFHIINQISLGQFRRIKSNAQITSSVYLKCFITFGLQCGCSAWATIWTVHTALIGVWIFIAIPTLDFTLHQWIENYWEKSYWYWIGIVSNKNVRNYPKFTHMPSFVDLQSYFDGYNRVSYFDLSSEAKHILHVRIYLWYLLGHLPPNCPSNLLIRMVAKFWSLFPLQTKQEDIFVDCIALDSRSTDDRIKPYGENQSIDFSCLL